jgi:urease accessory protein
VPDPLIPFAGAAYRQESTWEVDESATLIAGEVVTTGREARGESARYQRVELEIDARRPGGQDLFSDACVLAPDGMHGLAFLGGYTTLGSLFVVSSKFQSASFAELAEHPAVAAGYAGWSDLPNHAGAWFKVMAHDSATAIGAVQAAWATSRRVILDAGLPPKRRF